MFKSREFPISDNHTTSSIAKRYRRFANVETGGSSPTYTEWANAVADHSETLRFLAELPYEKQQPNLLFAAFRYSLGEPENVNHFLRDLHANLEQVRAVMESRRTQTNEPHRCASILPILSQFEEPLALVEAGASAGLCLIPDHYRYDYGEGIVGSSGPIFKCDSEGPVPIPVRLPNITWRRGLDTHPLSLEDADNVRWLECLIWPEHTDRRERFKEAVVVAKQHPIEIQEGDLRTDIESLLAQAPGDCRIVVFHTTVLAYLTKRSEIQDFAKSMRSNGVTWISNEAPEVLGTSPKKPTSFEKKGPLVLSLDGEPAAFSSPHGRWLHWL